VKAGQEDHLTPHHLGHVQAVQGHFPCLLGAAGEQELLPAVANAVDGSVLIEAPPAAAIHAWLRE
jgi:hypothetical protein